MLKIIKSYDSTTVEWDDLWESCETSTFYHSRKWSEIWQDYSNGSIRSVPKTITFSDGKKALIPLSRLSYFGGLVKRYSITGPPAGSLQNYGNWLSTGSLTQNHITLLAQYLISNYRNLVWRLNPYDY